MLKTLTLIATAAATLATAPAVAAPARAFDPMTGAFRLASNDYCIRSGWGEATQIANRLIRKGDCHSEADWRRRGIAFERVTEARANTSAITIVAAR